MARSALHAGERVRFVGDTATVSLDLHLTGTSEQRSIDARFRYLRVWKALDRVWQVIAGAGMPMP